MEKDTEKTIRRNSLINELCVIVSYAYRICDEVSIDEILSRFTKEIESLIANEYWERKTEENQMVRNIITKGNPISKEPPKKRGRFADYVEVQDMLSGDSCL